MILGIDASRANVQNKTGTELYSFEVIRRLPALLPEVDIRLYVREPLQPELRALLTDRVTEVILDWPPKILWTHLRLSWELWRRKPDVLFVTADTVPFFTPTKTVTTIHDIAFERFPELYRSASIQRHLGILRPLIHLMVRLLTLGRYGASERDYHRWSVRHALRVCQHILTPSEFSKREIVETLKAEPEKITVTPLGVRQADFFSSQRGQAKQELSKAGISQPFFLFLGRLETKKNISALLAGYATYIQETPNPLDLVLAGSPGYGWEAAQRWLTPEVSSHVHQLGYVRDPLAIALQVEAQALIMISQYEGFGIPAVESLAASVPVVASRAGSLPEVLGSAALFVDDPSHPADVSTALQRISQDKQLRQGLLDEGSLWVRQFTWEETSRKTAVVLRQALALPPA